MISGSELVEIDTLLARFQKFYFWWPFCIFLGQHSHDRNFGPILFRFGHNAAQRYPVFAIENQQNRLVTSGFIENRAYDFSRFSPKIAAKTKIVRYRQVRCRFRLIRTCRARI